MDRIKNALFVMVIAAIVIVIGQQFDIKPATTIMVLVACFVLFGFFLIWVFKNEDKLKAWTANNNKQDDKS
jgi:membrane protein YdbS with pleckstrin-like domain